MHKSTHCFSAWKGHNFIEIAFLYEDETWDSDAYYGLCMMLMKAVQILAL